MDATEFGARRDTGSQLSDREYRFATEQYMALTSRVGLLQSEREVWIRHSILATFAFFGWVAIYRDQAVALLMLESIHLHFIYLLPILLNLGGALRFVFLQRDVRRLSARLLSLERVLALPDDVRLGPDGRPLPTIDWHAPSICYWLFANAASAGAVLTLGYGMWL